MDKTRFERATDFALTWTPRVIAVGIGGYYGLGLAYELGIMASIDKIAIYVFRHIIGRAGLGALMPTFQWYSAISVRAAAAIGAGIIYEVASRVFDRCLACRPA